MHAIENHPPDSDTRHPEAMLFEIQRLSTEDGPGIRTTVFFKGCSLACTWCHNPESISAQPQLHWIASRCIGCGTCCTECPEGALDLSADGVTIDRTRCTNCGQCAAECPSTAMEIIGTRWSLDNLVHEVLKDRAYFASSGGGVTAGGGEPGLQAPFLAAFLRTLKQESIHTAVDTCGCFSGRSLDDFLPFTDLVLYDLKEIDPNRHRMFTGCANARILDNLQTIRARMAAGASPGELWIRTPVIPDATATEANIAGIGHWIADHLRGAVSRWELCAFNNLCRDKYLRLDRDWPLKANPLLSRDMMEHLADIARCSGVDPDIVHWSGSTQCPVT
ncbi:MAG: glycyl-radical enzyme activating protein [Desulfosarcina sp.]|nr:glycyl-radical enzyme activating protein [Desulfosarcina sp.]